jgi:hypothetical protein
MCAALRQEGLGPVHDAVFLTESQQFVVFRYEVKVEVLEGNIG